MSDDAKVYYVYALFRPAGFEREGIPFYIGKGKGKRWLDHEKVSEAHPNKHLTAIVKKAKRLDLEIPKIKIRENLTEQEAFEIEKAFIKAIGRGKNGPLVNMTDGGDGSSGWKHSPEWRASMSQTMKGRPGTMKGKTHSQETKRKMSEVARNRPPEYWIAASLRMRGKRPSEKCIEQSRVTKLGKKQPKETVEKRATKHRGRKNSPETIERMRVAQRKIADQMSAIAKAHWEDPVLREKMSKGISQAMKGNKNALGFVHTPETRANMSEGQRRRAPPTKKTRAKMSKTATDKWADPDHRSMMVAKMTAAASRPEVRAQNSEKLKKLWADPEFRKRRLEAIKAGKQHRRSQQKDRQK
jgi:hypothetical protein